MDQLDDNEEIVFTKKEVREMLEGLRKIASETETRGYDYGFPTVASTARKMIWKINDRLIGIPPGVVDEHTRTEDCKKTDL